MVKINKKKVKKTRKQSTEPKVSSVTWPVTHIPREQSFCRVTSYCFSITTIGCPLKLRPHVPRVDSVISSYAAPCETKNRETNNTHSKPEIPIIPLRSINQTLNSRLLFSFLEFQIFQRFPSPLDLLEYVISKILVR